MTKNKLMDLNDHLFMQLERLNDEDLNSDQIEQEAKRAEAIVSVADQIVRNAALQLDAVKVLANHGEHLRRHLPMIEGRGE